VSISNGNVLIGRPGGLFSDGSAYVYRQINGGWKHWSSLTPSNPNLSDVFGSAVAINGPVALVGAYRKSDPEFRSGAVYVFRQRGGVWTEERKLSPSDSVSNGGFGQSISMSGDSAVIGAVGYGPVLGAGAAFVYSGPTSSWSDPFKLVTSDAFFWDAFGSQVRIFNDLILSSAPQDTENGYPAGSAYFFSTQQGTWVQLRKVASSQNYPNDSLGPSVTLGDTFAFVEAGDSVAVFVVPGSERTLRDFADFQNCYGPKGLSLSSVCVRTDRCAGTGIDLCDLNELLSTFAGP